MGANWVFGAINLKATLSEESRKRYRFNLIMYCVLALITVLPITLYIFEEAHHFSLVYNTFVVLLNVIVYATAIYRIYKIINNQVKVENHFNKTFRTRFNTTWLVIH